MATHVSVSTAAEKIRPLLQEAKKAYGSQPPDSPARMASEQVNALILQYVDAGGRIPDLARALDGDISLSGLRRRIRIARGVDQSSLEGQEQVVGRVSRPRGSRNPEDVKKAAEKIQRARQEGGRAYGDAVREVYDENISLNAVAKEMGLTYYSLWSAKRTSW